MDKGTDIFTQNTKRKSMILRQARKLRQFASAIAKSNSLARDRADILLSEEVNTD